MDAHSEYEQLVAWSRELAMLSSTLELLSWDELTHMPRGGVDGRGRQLAYLSGLHHDAATNPRVAQWLDAVERSTLVADPESPAAVNVREWRWQYDRRTRLPRKLVEELATVTTAAQQEWAAARQESRFERFLPSLEHIVRLKREEASCHGQDACPYDAMIGDYEPGMRSSDLVPLFAALRIELVKLLDAIQGAPRRTSPAILRREYPVERQRIFVEAIAADVGFDFDRGRLDSTTHPFFSSLGPGDCRITTRYCQNDLGDALFSVLHEMGHGLYEQGLDPEHYGTPFGESSTMCLHESQSRLWEQYVGKSLPFWRHFFPRARDIFHDSLRDVTVDDFYRAANHVEPGWSRVRADAVSYDLHILVRFELEQALLSGDLPPRDLPQAWNEAYRDTLGVTPDSDAEGCLQDGHWSAGQFGYFPDYTLGNLFAAQLFAHATFELPQLKDEMAAGRFGELHAWLRQNLYRHGQRWPAAELLRRVTGRPLSHEPHIAALRARCAEIYGIT